MLEKAGKSNGLKLRFLFGKGVVDIILFLEYKGKARYSEIKKERYVIGDRSLSRTLKKLQEKGIISRAALPTFPISTSYSLTEKGKAVAKHLKELALELS
jgi:DNA-binding HxlR family transcriptional regulator